jgi:predicted PurR-regulated permease PerM
MGEGRTVAGDDRNTESRPPDNRPSLYRIVPRRLVVLVGWVVGLAALGGGGWLAIWVLSQIAVVVLACAIAMFFIALLEPVNRGFRRIGVIPGLAAVLSVLLLIVVLAAVGLVVEVSIANRSAELVHDFGQTFNQLEHRLQSSSLPINQHTLTGLQHDLVHALKARSSMLTTTAVHATRAVIDIGVGALLGLFVVIFLLYDGERLWTWFRNLFPRPAAQRLKRAGEAAWVTLTGFIQGSFVIACIHSIVIGTTMYLLGVSIFIPLAILVFIGSFVPIVGAFVAGAFAVLITLGTVGFVPAVILLAVLLIENEIESHVLQPFVVGRYVRLHPLAIVVVLTLGAYVAGLWGTLFAVPATGVLRAIWGPLNGKPTVAPVGGRSRLSQLSNWIRRRFTRSK